MSGPKRRNGQKPSQEDLKFMNIPNDSDKKDENGHLERLLPFKNTPPRPTTERLLINVFST